MRAHDSREKRDREKEAKKSVRVRSAGNRLAAQFFWAKRATLALREHAVEAAAAIANHRLSSTALAQLKRAYGHPRASLFR